MRCRGRAIVGCVGQRLPGGRASERRSGTYAGPHRTCAAQLPRYSDFISSALAGRTPIARDPDADAPCACAP